MKQSKLESHIEAVANIGSGFILSFFVWMTLVGPLVDSGVFDPRSPHDAFLITCIFTVTSYIRSYFWRRFFNAGLHRLIHRFVSRRNRPFVKNDHVKINAPRHETHGLCGWVVGNSSFSDALIVATVAGNFFYQPNELEHAPFPNHCEYDMCAPGDK